MKKYLLLYISIFILCICFENRTMAQEISGYVPTATSLKEKIAALEAAGTAEAKYHLSTLYENGFDSILADSLRSAQLLKEAAEGGYAPAQNYLGFRLYKENPDSALYWIEKAASGGDLKAMSNLAFIIMEESGIQGEDSIRAEQKYSAAVPLLRKAAEGGNSPALSALADLYREGKGVAKDTLVATTLYLDAIRGGFGDAERRLLQMNLSRYAELSPETAMAEGIKAASAGADAVAFTLFQKAAQGKIPKAYTLLADAYSSAKGTDYNHQKAIEFYIEGAVEGDPSAQFILAELLEIFPDAADGLLPENMDSKYYKSPQYWYGLAASGGVTSAGEAAARLFSQQ